MTHGPTATTIGATTTTGDAHTDGEDTTAVGTHHGTTAAGMAAGMDTIAPTTAAGMAATTPTTTAGTTVMDIRTDDTNITTTDAPMDEAVPTDAAAHTAVDAAARTTADEVARTAADAAAHLPLPVVRPKGSHPPRKGHPLPFIPEAPIPEVAEAEAADAQA